MTGVVVDATGAVLPHAGVELTGRGGRLVQSGDDRSAGVFRFERVPPGRYDVRATFEGFTPTIVRVTVGARAPAAVRVTLPLAGLTQEITVSNAPPEVNAAAGANSDAVTIDQNMLESLPVFDQDFIATLSRFLDTGSIGTGGVTVVVNGMEVNALNVSASAVQQIKINQDPYSAEYSRPGPRPDRDSHEAGRADVPRRREPDRPRFAVQRAQRLRGRAAARAAAHRRRLLRRPGRPQRQDVVHVLGAG